jgi:hypothetical protein
LVTIVSALAAACSSSKLNACITVADGWEGCETRKHTTYSCNERTTVVGEWWTAAPHAASHSEAGDSSWKLHSDCTRANLPMSQCRLHTPVYRRLSADTTTQEPFISTRKCCVVFADLRCSRANFAIVEPLEAGFEHHVAIGFSCACPRE